MKVTLNTAERERRSQSAAEEDALLQQWEPLARYLAHRFAGAAEREDLEQVARLALLRAARRFDPAQGTQFRTFAAQTIVGHLRHYIRDQAPAVRIPRRWWELRPRLERAREQLAQGLGREPTLGEMAARLAVREEDVAGVLAAVEFSRFERLDHPRATSEGRPTEPVSETIGCPDPQLEAVEQHVALQQVMMRLPTRLRDVLERRYFQGRSQQQVGRDLGVSQMQISRLERKALEQLRGELRRVWGLGPEASTGTPLEGLHLPQGSAAASPA
jgi:RNA polymerase sigma-B factor